MHDKQEQTMDNLDVTMLFKGVRLLWKTRTNLDVVLPFHQYFDCIEIIAFCVDRNYESPRLYVSYSTIQSKINKAEIERKLEVEREMLLRQHKAIDESAARLRLINEAISQYVVVRINALLNKQGNDFQIYLQPSHDDIVNFKTGKMDVEMVKPPELQEYLIHRQNRRTDFAQFEVALQELQLTTKLLQNAAQAAETFADALETNIQLEDTDNENYDVDGGSSQLQETTNLNPSVAVYNTGQTHYYSSASRKKHGYIDTQLDGHSVVSLESNNTTQRERSMSSIDRRASTIRPASAQPTISDRKASKAVVKNTNRPSSATTNTTVSSMRNPKTKLRHIDTLAAANAYRSDSPALSTGSDRHTVGGDGTVTGSIRLRRPRRNSKRDDSDDDKHPRAATHRRRSSSVVKKNRPQSAKSNTTFTQRRRTRHQSHSVTDLASLKKPAAARLGGEFGDSLPNTARLTPLSVDTVPETNAESVSIRAGNFISQPRFQRGIAVTDSEDCEEGVNFLTTLAPILSQPNSPIKTSEFSPKFTTFTSENATTEVSVPKPVRVMRGDSFLTGTLAEDPVRTEDSGGSVNRFAKVIPQPSFSLPPISPQNILPSAIDHRHFDRFAPRDSGKSLLKYITAMNNANTAKRYTQQRPQTCRFPRQPREDFSIERVIQEQRESLLSRFMLYNSQQMSLNENSVDNNSNGDVEHSEEGSNRGNNMSQQQHSSLLMSLKHPIARLKY